MSYFKFATDLFLEVAEITKFRGFLDDQGFRKNILENSAAFGLIKSQLNPSFTNGRVERDLDNALGQKTIKIAPLIGVNSDGQFLVNQQVNNFTVPSDGNWYWVRCQHQYTTQEAGKVSVDISGNLVGVGTEFLKTFRISPNFPTRVKFLNSVGNLLEYDVLDVTDDTHAILVHPAITIGGNAQFVAESNLFFEIVGTFTPNVAVSNDWKFPFQYDSCLVELIVEVSTNTRPSFISGQQFYLARVRVQNGNIVIQDKRIEYWETKGSQNSIDISRVNNPLVGIEATKWQNLFNTGDRNIVQIAWGMRSTNWAVDSSQNIVTLFGSAQGGSFKTVNDFTDGDLNGYRFYTNNGKYSKVINSIKQGSAINCFLDILDVDNYSTDGGDTFISQEVLVTPDCEEVELRFTADPADNVSNVNKILTFPTNTSVAECLITVYKDPSVLYNVQYRYKSFKEFTEWQPINSGSYFTETSFTSNGILKPVSDQVLYTYTSDPTDGFAQLTISPNAYKRFANTVYKGDIIGVNTITAFTPGQVIDLQVGVAKRYQHIVGNINITDDVFINLSRTNAVEGNEFRIHFECNSLSIGTNNIIITDNLQGGTTIIVKEIMQGDINAMLSQDGGIVVDCVFDNTGKWIMYQNYDLATATPQPVSVTASSTTGNMVQVTGGFPNFVLNATNRVLRTGSLFIGDINTTANLDPNVQLLSGGSAGYASYVYTLPNPLSNNRYLPIFTFGNSGHDTQSKFNDNYMCSVNVGYASATQIFFAIQTTATSNHQAAEVRFALISID